MATTKKLTAAAAGVSTGSGGGGGGGGGGSGSSTLDISGASYANKSYDVSSQATFPSGVDFNPAGTKMIVSDFTTKKFFTYSLSTAWDVTTASYDGSSSDYALASAQGSLLSFCFGDNGTKLYNLDHNNAKYHQHTLTTAYDVSTASADSKSLHHFSTNEVPRGAAFKPDGTKFYIAAQNYTLYGDKPGIFEWDLSTAFDLSTASYNNFLELTNSANYTASGSNRTYGFSQIHFNSSGTQVFVQDTIATDIKQYDLTTAWDISSGSYANKNFDLSNEMGFPRGLAFDPDATKMYAVGNTNDTVYQYDTNGTWTLSSSGGGSATYVQDVFNISTYTGTGSAQSIVTNLDMATDGGLVWLKSRSAATDHQFYDTERGATKALKTGWPYSASVTNSTGLTSFNADGFSIGTHNVINDTTENYVGWSFKKHASFFDVQTWTGDGTNSRSIGHALNHDVGCIMIKSTSNSGNLDFWWVWHKDLSSNENNLNMSGAVNEEPNSAFPSTAPTTTDFYVSSASSTFFNTNGHTYVAYIFADNNGDGIFGANADQDIIRCGVYTGDGTSLRTIDVGFEAEFILTKRITNGGQYDHWKIHDQTRGMTASGTAETLYPNLVGAAQFFTYANWAQTDSSGWKTGASSNNYENVNGSKYIYIAIRKTMPVSSSGSSGGLNIEDVYSINRYAGTSATQTITNGVDLSTHGGAVLTARSDVTNSAARSVLTDTTRGATKEFDLGSSGAEATYNLSTFNTDGYTLSSGNYLQGNYSGYEYYSQTWRNADDFFAHGQYTGNGSTQAITHGLNGTVGMIWVKSSGNHWAFWHRGFAGTTSWNYLNLAYAKGSSNSVFGNNSSYVDPTSTEFTVGSDGKVNSNNTTYTYYVFAHNDGSTHGDDSNQDMIKCGTYTGNGDQYDGAMIDLGFRPQSIWITPKDYGDKRYMMNSLTGIPNEYAYNQYNPVWFTDSYGGRKTTNHWVKTENTGFQIRNNQLNYNNNEYIYMAIRRGNMGKPTDVTKVFKVDNVGESTPLPYYKSGFTTDMVITKSIASYITDWFVSTRDWPTQAVKTNSNAIGGNGPIAATGWDNNEGVGTATLNTSNNPGVAYLWKTARSFFDHHMYMGKGTGARTLNHDVQTIPEMVWVKRDTASHDWYVYHKDAHASSPEDYHLILNSDAAVTSSTIWDGTAPTASTIRVATSLNTNSANYIMFCFGTADGVSKVGGIAHTTGSNTVVDCGFSSGSSLVMLKRTDAAGNWLTYDSTRGIVSGNDSRLSLNSNALEVTNVDEIDPNSSGFEIGAALPTGNYIYYALA